MRVLLDTHILLWFLEGHARLSVETQDLLNRSTVTKAVSVVSFWELSIKHSLGKISLQKSPVDMMQLVGNSNLNLLPIQAPHLSRLEQLPMHHRDPFDRLLIATAMAEGLVLITADQAFTAYADLNLLTVQ